MEVYITKKSKLSGSDFFEVRKKAERYYSTLTYKTKRRTYVRSAYFKKDKIFLIYFGNICLIKITRGIE